MIYVDPVLECGKLTDRVEQELTPTGDFQGALRIHSGRLRPDLCRNAWFVLLGRLEMKLIDAIIAEPLGAAHANPEEACERVGDVVAHALEELAPVDPDELVRGRYERFRALGVFEER